VNTIRRQSATDSIITSQEYYANLANLIQP
jgi:hypothetical protein